MEKSLYEIVSQIATELLHRSRIEAAAENYFLGFQRSDALTNLARYCTGNQAFYTRNKAAKICNVIFLSEFPPKQPSIHLELLI